MNILDQLRKSVKTDSKSEAMVLLERGKQLLDSYFYDRSMIEFSKAIQADRELASKTIADIYRDMQGSGDLSALISVGSSLLSMNPDNVDLANAIGNLCRKNGDWNQAISLYEHCLRLRPKHNYAAYNLPATIARLELADSVAVRTIREYEQRTSFYLPEYQVDLPELWELHQDMMEAEEEEGDFEEEDSFELAEEEFDESVEPDEVHWQNLFDYILNYTKENASFRQKLLLTLGFCCLDRKVAEVARKCFDQLSGENTKDLNLSCFWILSLSLTGKRQDTIDKIVQLLGEYPNHRYANANLGFLYQQAERVMPARRHFFITHKLLQRSQGYFDLEECLQGGEKYFNQQNLKRALEVYQPLIPEIEAVDLLNRIGHLLLQKNNLDEAYKVFQRALRKDRSNVVARQELKAVREAYLNMAEADLKKPDWKAAAYKLEQALAILPTIKVLKQLFIVYGELENWKPQREVKRKICELEEAELERQQQQFLEKAVQEEVGKVYKSAMRSYEQALRVLPKRKIFLRMVSLCEKEGKEEMVPRLTSWFNQLEEDYKWKEIDPISREKISNNEKPLPATEKSKRKKRKRCKAKLVE
jgi:tetratricopeptide (TPR) repeat protein